MRLACSTLVAIVVFCAAPSTAQLSGVAGDFDSAVPTGPVLAAHVSHTSLADTVAVQGTSEPQPWWGYGGYFAGGYVGVAAEAVLAGAGERTGVRGVAGDSPANYGVLGEASSYLDSSASAGVFGSASCTGVGCVAYAGYFDGDLAYTGSLVNASDQMLKKDVEPLDRVLDQVLALEVVTFEFKERAITRMNLPKGQQIGFIAQQVAEIAPQLVVDAAHLAPGSEKVVREPIRYKGLKTMEMIPLLVRAIQEQQAQIEALRAEIAPLRNRLAEIEKGPATPGRIASASYRTP